MNALIGKKLGMTRVFGEDGSLIPVTAIQVGPCVVVQRKTSETDGYEAAQLGFEDRNEKKASSPAKGHFKKAGTGVKRYLSEVRVVPSDAAKTGDVFDVSLFEAGNYVDVTGRSKGRGFQGVVKRHGMSGGRGSHGSGMHRRTGSIGMKEWPARVAKGKKMPGHMGHERVTTQNLKVVQVRAEDHLLLVRGSVPGPAGSLVSVRQSIKTADKTS